MGFATTYDGCTGVIAPPQPPVPVCTITNTADAQPRLRLQVRKIVVGSTRPPSDFSFRIGGRTIRFDADGVVEGAVPAGTYTVTEVPVDGFTTTTSGCTNIVVEAPQPTVPVCTITNTADNQAEFPLGNFVKCVDNFPDGSFSATFGYYNPNPIAVKVAPGRANSVSPGGPDRGQPTTFQSGTVSAAFTIADIPAGTSVTWTVANVPPTSASVEAMRVVHDEVHPEPAADAGGRLGLRHMRARTALRHTAPPSATGTPRATRFPFRSGRRTGSSRTRSIAASRSSSRRGRSRVRSPSATSRTARISPGRSSRPSRPRPGRQPRRRGRTSRRSAASTRPILPTRRIHPILQIRLILQIRRRWARRRIPIGLFVQCVTNRGSTLRRRLRIPERQRGRGEDRRWEPEPVRARASGPRPDDRLPPGQPPGGIHGHWHPGGKRARLGGHARGRHTDCNGRVELPGEVLGRAGAGSSRSASSRASSTAAPPTTPSSGTRATTRPTSRFRSGSRTPSSPRPSNRGQPTVFSPGKHENAFTIRGIRNDRAGVLVRVLPRHALRDRVLLVRRPSAPGRTRSCRSRSRPSA